MLIRALLIGVLFFFFSPACITEGSLSSSVRQLFVLRELSILMVSYNGLSDFHQLRDEGGHFYTTELLRWQVNWQWSTSSGWRMA